MAKALVVVESPAKAKTINKYLGRDFKVVASMGHIRDLPKSKLGVAVDDDFTEEYESIPSRKKVIKELKDAAKDATDIYVATEEQSKAVLADIEHASWTVASVTTKERRRNAPAPFITSKLQQSARFPVKKTMMLAQQLYEGIELPGLGVDGPVGLITYMRTDSVRVSDEALAAVREQIKT